MVMSPSGATLTGSKDMRLRVEGWLVPVVSLG